MSDPFGDDDVDFDTGDFLASAYKNALAFLADDHRPACDALPNGLINPVPRRATRRNWHSVSTSLSSPAHSVAPFAWSMTEEAVEYELSEVDEQKAQTFNVEAIPHRSKSR